MGRIVAPVAQALRCCHRWDVGAWMCFKIEKRGEGIGMKLIGGVLRKNR